MKWKIIKENKREFADKSYYLKAERECKEGKLILEICWAQIMYALSINLISKNTGLKSFLKKESKRDLYGCLVFYNDRIEKYGHQIMRMTEESPISKFKRLDSLQKDGVLNYVISEKHNVTFETTLPEK